MDLADVTTDDLLAEVQRRMHCMDKPEKRVIMVGEILNTLLDIYREARLPTCHTARLESASC